MNKSKNRYHSGILTALLIAVIMLLVNIISAQEITYNKDGKKIIVSAMFWSIPNHIPLTDTVDGIPRAYAKISAVDSFYQLDSMGIEILEIDESNAIAYVPCHLIKDIHELESVYGFTLGDRHREFKFPEDDFNMRIPAGILCRFTPNNCQNLPLSASLRITSYDSVKIEDQQILRYDSCIWSGYVSSCYGEIHIWPIDTGFYKLTL